jgi:hypothetical protein
MPRKKRAREIPNCWEIIECPPEVCEACPAHPDNGRECWKLTGTKCAGGSIEKMSLTRKIMHCRNKCAFYKKHLKKLYR